MSTPVPPRPVIVALGSNLGDSLGTLRAAVRRLRAVSAGALHGSSVWNTTPVDCPPGSPAFLNAVVCFPSRPGETPESLLARLQEWEREAGRRPKIEHNEARPLDLDLIGFGDERRATPSLVLPHPRAHLRRFVLQPLVEIAPETRLPGWSGSAAELLRRLESDEVLVRYRSPAEAWVD